MLKELVLSSIVSLVGVQIYPLGDSIEPVSPSAYGSRQIEIEGPGLIVTLNERFTYSVDSYTFDSDIEFKRPLTNNGSITISRNFTVTIPGSTFQVVSYSSVSNNALRLATVKDLVGATNLDSTLLYTYQGISLAPGQTVSYGLVHETLELRIKEIREARYWSWWSWSDYKVESTLYFDVVYTNSFSFLDVF